MPSPEGEATETYCSKKKKAEKQKISGNRNAIHCAFSVCLLPPRHPVAVYFIHIGRSGREVEGKEPDVL
jgi:hypothetical protein